MTAKQLRDERAKKAKDIRGLADTITRENRAFTDEERKKNDALYAEIAELDTRIADLDKAEALDRRMAEPDGDRSIGRGDAGGQADDETREDSAATSRPARLGGVSDEQRTIAVGAWFVGNRRRLTGEEQRACEATGIHPGSGELVLRTSDTNRVRRMRDAGWEGGFGRSYEGAERRALSAVIGSSGAFTIADSFVNQLELAMFQSGGILQAADILRTDNGALMKWPTADDTSNEGEMLGESTAVGEASPSFGQQAWSAYKFSSKKVLVPSELFRDSAFDVAGVIASMLGERIGRKLNSMLTTGTGASQPHGLATAAPAGKTAASATAFTWDELEDLISSVDPAHRQGSAFMFHDNIRSYIHKMKDGIGRPLWADGPNGTPPASLKGYPWFINQNMQSSIASGTKTVIFGQLKKYKVRQVRDLRLYRLTEVNRTSDQDVFIGFLEADGNLLDPTTGGTYCPVKALVQA